MPSDNEREETMRTLLAALLPLILVGCVNFSMTQPPDNTRIVLPATLPVEIQATPRITTARANVDGTAAPVQWTYSPDSSMASGPMSVPPGVPVGTHTLTVEADVPCWYCAGGSFRQQASRSFCAASPGPINVAGVPNITTISKADGNAWIIRTGSPPSVSVGANTGTSTSIWLFQGSRFSQAGVIQSVDQPCLCLQSTDAKQDTPIGLAGCNSKDATQVWQALPSGTFAFLQNTGRGISDACLTSVGGKLIQRTCRATDDQLWTFRDNFVGIVTASPF
jgi:hypothetical protein